MDHIKSLLIKFVAIAFTVFALFGLFYNVSWASLLWISVLVTGISYAIGDLFLLRKYGNMTATISDFVLAFLSLWLFGNVFLEGNIPIVTISILAAFFIACCEPFIHSYIVNHIPVESREDLRTMNQLQTEFAEEMDPEITKEKDMDK
ncbi:YndM family protein [Virgibacillus ndiopensis]|uniref:YndM family protein n=1 Tax=Virgibacillus ndiopensis TaxID=2004408 RepID=UPI000C087078|nr:YndM family protein [Virgibacillus ndiopensis]